MFVPEEVWHVVGDAVVADGDGEPHKEEDTSSLPQDGNSEDVGDVWGSSSVLPGDQVSWYGLHLQSNMIIIISKRCVEI